MQRTGFIGGSDLSDLFSLQPYGCERKLWYEKTGVEADYPFHGNVHTKRGHFFEPIAAQMYEAETLRPVMAIPEGADVPRHPKYPFIGGHPDRYLPSENGILEIKVPGERAFRTIKREGLPESYILQLQHYLLLSGADMGSFAVLWADGVDLKYFDVTPDQGLQDHIIEGCAKFWETLEKHPDDVSRLDPGDRRCQTCPWRTRCQGAKLIDLGEGDPGEIPLVEDFPPEVLNDYWESLTLYQEAEKLLDGAKDRIKAQLRTLKLEAVQAPGTRIYWRQVNRRTVDTKKLKAKYAAVYEECSRISPSIPLRVFAI